MDPKSINTKWKRSFKGVLGCKKESKRQANKGVRSDLKASLNKEEELDYNTDMSNWVSAGSHGWVNVKDVEFLDISEGLQGDEMTFEYMGEEYTSVIAIGSRPG